MFFQLRCKIYYRIIGRIIDHIALFRWWGASQTFMLFINFILKYFSVFPPLASVAVHEMPNLLPPLLLGTNLPQTYELQHALGNIQIDIHISIPWNVLECLGVSEGCWEINHNKNCLFIVITPIASCLLFCVVFAQVCMTCIRCKSCGVTPGKSWDLDWNHEQDLCPDCSSLHKKGKTSLVFSLWFAAIFLSGYMFGKLTWISMCGSSNGWCH